MAAALAAAPSPAQTRRSPPSASGLVVLLTAADGPAVDVGLVISGAGATGDPAGPAELQVTDAGLAPALLRLAPGARVRLVNRQDGVAHHLFSRSSAARFDHDLRDRGAHATVAFHRPGEVAIYCDDHPEEAAYAVVRNGRDARSDERGRAQLELSPGRYTVRVADAALTAAPIEVEVPAHGHATIEVALEARPRRHRNKRGRPYPKQPGAIAVEVVRKDGGKRVAADGAVVWLAGSPAPYRPGVRAAADDGAEMSAIKKRFTPRVLPVATGGSVGFPNLDRIYHNVFSLSAIKNFDLGLYKNGKSKSVAFDKPGVVKVYCNIHPKMVGYVVVVDGANYAAVDASGRVRLDGVPPGSWTLKVWDEKGGQSERAVTVASNATADVAFELDASGFRERPHRNKYGEEYPDPDDEDSRY